MMGAAGRMCQRTFAVALDGHDLRDSAGGRKKTPPPASPPTGASRASWPYCSAIDYFQLFGRKRMPPQNW
jgi:hypothetical protein